MFPVFSLFLANPKIHQEAFVEYQEPVVGYQEVFVDYKEAFVEYQETFVEYQETIVGYKEVFVEYQEAFVDFLPGNEWALYTPRRAVRSPPACEFACTALAAARGPKEPPPGHGPPAPPPHGPPASTGWRTHAVEDFSSCNHLTCKQAVALLLE